MIKVKMIDYRPELAGYFTSLNLAWLEKYFAVEALDEEILGNPGEHIIAKNGFIFFAIYDEAIAGTFALLKQQEGIYELAKMAVSEAFQGKQVGNHMLQYCISKAKELKIRKIVLFSNTFLKPAIHLYRKYGFTEVPLGNSDYKRSNIKMELTIS